MSRARSAMQEKKIPTPRFSGTPLPLTSLLPWKTLTETEMLRQHLLIDLVSDGKGHAGKGLQHSHAGGYELLLLYSHLITDIPTVPGTLWVWIPPMSTNIRVLCYLWNCRRGTLKMYSALPPEGLNTITLTLVQPKAFKQHFARCEHSLSNSPNDFQAITVYDYTAGRCCLYRIAMN